MLLTDPIEQISFKGMIRAKVVKRDDPIMEGRVAVWVPRLMSFLADTAPAGPPRAESIVVPSNIIPTPLPREYLKRYQSVETRLPIPSDPNNAANRNFGSGGGGGGGAANDNIPFINSGTTLGSGSNNVLGSGSSAALSRIASTERHGSGELLGSVDLEQGLVDPIIEDGYELESEPEVLEPIIPSIYTVDLIMNELSPQVRNKVDEAFIQGVIDMSERLDLNPVSMLALMTFETAGQLQSDTRNPKNSATGLIQFTTTGSDILDPPAKGDVDYLASLDRVEQLKWVEQYFTRWKPTNSLAGIYTAIFSPANAEKPDSEVLYKAGEKGYEDNKIFDKAGTGIITKRALNQEVYNYFSSVFPNIDPDTLANKSTPSGNKGKDGLSGNCPPVPPHTPISTTDFISNNPGFYSMITNPGDVFNYASGPQAHAGCDIGMKTDQYFTNTFNQPLKLIYHVNTMDPSSGIVNGKRGWESVFEPVGQPGTQIRFSHVKPEPGWQPGQIFQPGEALATPGVVLPGEASTGKHLHFEIRHPNDAGYNEIKDPAYFNKLLNDILSGGTSAVDPVTGQPYCGPSPEEWVEQVSSNVIDDSGGGGSSSQESSGGGGSSSAGGGSSSGGGGGSSGGEQLPVLTLAELSNIPSSLEDSVVSTLSTTGTINSVDYLWCRPTFSYGGMSGGYRVPQIGEWVFMIFEDEDPQKPYYMPYGPTLEEGIIYMDLPQESDMGSISNVADEIAKPNVEILEKTPNGNLMGFDYNRAVNTFLFALP